MVIITKNRIKLSEDEQKRIERGIADKDEIMNISKKISKTLNVKYKRECYEMPLDDIMGIALFLAHHHGIKGIIDQAIGYTVIKQSAKDKMPDYIG